MQRSLLLKSLWFQVLWFLAVIGRQDFEIILGVAILMTLVISINKQQINMRWLLLVVLLGIGLDSMNVYLGIYQFDTQWIPSWLVGLWTIFAWYAYQLRELLIKYSQWLVLPVAAIGATLSYFAGMKLGAVAWPLTLTTTAIVVTIEWLLMMGIIRFSLANSQANNIG
jgi:hypothetical protein